jgi:hypothetical protein
MFRQTSFQPPQHGNGMWQPLAYGLDALGILAGISVLVSLAVSAFILVPMIIHH